MLISEAKLYGVYNFIVDYHTMPICHHVNMHTFRMILSDPWEGGGRVDRSHVNMSGMLIVSLRGVNSGFWFHAITKSVQDKNATILPSRYLLGFLQK